MKTLDVAYSLIIWSGVFAVIYLMSGALRDIKELKEQVKVIESRQQP